VGCAIFQNKKDVAIQVKKLKPVLPMYRSITTSYLI